MPSPWVVYTIVYLGLSALLVWAAMRYVRPTVARNARHPSRPPTLEPETKAP